MFRLAAPRRIDALTRVIAALTAPREGDPCTQDGVPGVLVRCPECDGTGLLHRPNPLPSLGPEWDAAWQQTLRRFGNPGTASKGMSADE